MSFSITDNSLMSNIQKLFSEKIEIFSAVDFSKVSVLTGIIKISLKVHFSRKHFCPFRNYWKTYFIKLCFIILYKLYKEYTTSAFFQIVMQVRFPKLNLVSLCTMNIVPVYCACTYIWHLEIYTIHLQLDYLRWKLLMDINNNKKPTWVTIHIADTWLIHMNFLKFLLKTIWSDLSFFFFKIYIAWANVWFSECAGVFILCNLCIQNELHSWLFLILCFRHS